jgi:Pentapeptide repeats (8 copies)
VTGARAGRTRVSVALLGVALASFAAGCGSQTVKATTPSLQVVTAPMSTSLVTAQGAWAIAVMGGSAASDNDFWQVFVRPAGASRWSLVTPPGVADNGGLVAAGQGTSMLIGFRPSQGLAFSPLATTSDAGKSWTPGLLDADLAAVPDALAVGPPGQTLALLHDGSIEAAPTATAATAGQWSRLTTLPALAASAPGRACGLVAVNAVSFGPDNIPMAAGSCARRGVAGVFADTGGTWRAAGPALPAGFGADQVQVLGLASAGPANTGPANTGPANTGPANTGPANTGPANTGPAHQGGGNAALLLAGPDLLAAWSDGAHWTVSGPAAADGVTASGFGPGGSVWALLGNGRAETIAGTGGSWQALPALPPGTATLAPGTAGGYDALAASGSRLTVWRLAKGASAWTKVQVINVPIQYGSSS